MSDEDDVEDGPQAEPAEGQPDNAASPKAFRKKRLDQEWAQREEQLFWRKLLAEPIGRRILWGLFRDGGAFEAIHAAGPTGVPDPLATEFYRGRTLFVWALYQKLAALDRRAILLMHDEHDPSFPKQPATRSSKPPRMKNG